MANAAENARKVESLLRRYNNPYQPYSYASPGAVQRHYKKKYGRTGKLKHIKTVLEHSDAYNYHREFHDTRNTNPMYIYARREHVELDLADMTWVAQENDDVRYLLTCIDGFTRRAWLVPMKRKDGATTLQAIKHLVENEMGDPPKKFYFDHGKDSC